jgi:hypothetical protein
MRRCLPLMAALLFLLPPSAAQARWRGQLEAADNRFESGFDIIIPMGFGGRFGVNLDNPVLDSTHLRVGMGFNYSHGRPGDPKLDGLNPFAVIYNGGYPIFYSGLAVDLNLWGPLEAELTGGLTVLEFETRADGESYPSYGFMAGPALRLDPERDNPLTARAGVLFISDFAGARPRLMLDVGPTLTW